MNTSAVILVADDDLDMLRAIQLTLELDGYQVVGVTNGREALQVLESQNVSLIVADIAMPEMNGYQLLERIRQVPEWVPIPIIFASARALDSDIRFGKELGVDDYLIKPIYPADLRATVRGNLRRAEQWRESMMRVTDNPSTNPEDLNRPLTIGKLSIDSRRHRVEFAGNSVSLSAREFMLLEYLAARAGEVIPVQEIIKITHNIDTNPAEAGSLIRPVDSFYSKKVRLSGWRCWMH